MEGERLDHDAFRIMRGHKILSHQDWSSLMERLSKIEQELERMKNNGAIHDHHADGGPS
jgi:hypothetical protein